ncbi:carboxymuconolactone decarboxylase family protein [Deinococcus cellulosilyticus]|uniref:Alkylhydroperoxidase n=1 Tax=Deinococcus cellulosilyticus (strain DSM 18568 / NBRC 106333 / KACC 11606 / 5516J-15) TaxID=1223518 RepID=A0A511MZV7_DEIC1|nr:carboxymuconolactone decarboxylase family protein [Deinococcus cellulosilyticus]GEM45656.1 alkylhydroperoxidase [Deinococcus cellulosilyticus NBRC 106333 = KACC 11606]
MKKLPATYRSFIETYPEIARAYQSLGEAIHQQGPLTERERRLVKLALAVGSQQEGAVHSQTRKGMDHGLTAEEMHQVVLLGMTTLGFPRTIAALTWVDDLLEPEASPKDPTADEPEQF